MGKTRSIEVARAWGGDSGEWDTHCYDIPIDTPEDKIEEVALAECRRETSEYFSENPTGPEMQNCWVYNIPDIEDDEEVTELQKLIEKATPIPWGAEWDDLDALSRCDRRLALHAVNILPKLVSALSGLNNAESCNCVSAYSWYGEGHCTACPCSWVTDLLEEVNNPR